MSYAKQGAIALSVALAWIIVFCANEALFDGSRHSIRANWIFLPAAVRLLAVLLFEATGCIGLMLGAFVVGMCSTSEPWPYVAGLSLTSGLAPYVVVLAYRRLNMIAGDLRNLRGVDICSLSLATALSNAVMLNAYLAAFGRFEGDIVQMLTVFVGDTVGIVVVLGLLSVALSFAMPRRR
ncbi:MAG: hypothetical protein RIS17_1953 [Pseudomonadota bacterium]|jgi:hypothetical protein